MEVNPASIRPRACIHTASGRVDGVLTPYLGRVDPGLIPKHVHVVTATACQQVPLIVVKIRAQKKPPEQTGAVFLYDCKRLLNPGIVDV